MTEVQNDPDRVVHPMRRRAGAEGFERVSWEEALGDIGRRLRAVLERHGPASVGWYMGNPGAFSYAHTLWVKGFLDALGCRTTTRPARRTSTTASRRARCCTARRCWCRSPTSRAPRS
jgi:anaerobic selenocysteine-containing dehydrogenase